MACVLLIEFNQIKMNRATACLKNNYVIYYRVGTETETEMETFSMKLAGKINCLVYLHLHSTYTTHKRKYVCC